jgi:hypothetical protein
MRKQRTKKDPQKKLQQVSYRLLPSHITYLSALAKEKGIGVSEALRFIINHFAEGYEL